VPPFPRKKERDREKEREREEGRKGGKQEVLFLRA
jgi:hypothetical protein